MGQVRYYNRPTHRKKSARNRVDRPDQSGRIVGTLKSMPGGTPRMSDVEGHGSAENGEGVWARSTAPQSPYRMRQVGIGFVIFAIGVAITVGIPLAMA